MKEYKDYKNEKIKRMIDELIYEIKTLENEKIEDYDVIKFDSIYKRIKDLKN